MAVDGVRATTAQIGADAYVVSVSGELDIATAGRFAKEFERTAERDARRVIGTGVVIGQAKGVLAERFGLDVHDAFHVLRTSARSNRMRLRDLAVRVVESRQTPREIEQTLSRSPRS